tara:strand:+ start:378 stop:578 length:201 start_codon:yes stop_codon:yes gene_type:complete
MFTFTEENRKQVLQYLWSRPYGEVAAIIGMLASLKNVQIKPTDQKAMQNEMDKIEKIKNASKKDLS